MENRQPYFLLELLITFILVWNCPPSLEVVVRSTTSVTDDLGPVTNITCVFPFDSFDRVEWLFTHERAIPVKRLTFQSTSPTEYHVSDSGRIITILNALQSDEGFYTCLVYESAEVTNSKFSMFSGSTLIEIPFYLPDPYLPKCYLEPNITVFTVGSNATYTCNASDSNPPVNVQLILEKTNGSNVNLSTKSEVTRTITTDDNNAIFVCIMSSDTFPTAPERRCTSGPITVQSLPISITTNTDLTFPTEPDFTSPTETGVNISTESWAVHTTVQTSASITLQENVRKAIIISISIGGVILILIVLSIVVWARIKKTKSDPSVGKMDDDKDTKTVSKNQEDLVAGNRPSIIDPSSTNALNHDSAFSNNSVTEDEIPSGVARSLDSSTERKNVTTKGLSISNPGYGPIGSVTLNQPSIDLHSSGSLNGYAVPTKLATVDEMSSDVPRSSDPSTKRMHMKTKDLSKPGTGYMPMAPVALSQPSIDLHSSDPLNDCASSTKHAVVDEMSDVSRASDPSTERMHMKTKDLSKPGYMPMAPVALSQLTVESRSTDVAGTSDRSIERMENMETKDLLKPSTGYEPMASVIIPSKTRVQHSS